MKGFNLRRLRYFPSASWRLKTPAQMRSSQSRTGETVEVIDWSRVALGLMHHVEFLSLDLVAAGVPVHESVSIEIVFGVAEVLPARQELLIKGVVKAAGVLVMIEYELRKSLYIESRMIMFDPDKVAQNRQLQKG